MYVCVYIYIKYVYYIYNRKIQIYIPMIYIREKNLTLNIIQSKAVNLNFSFFTHFG